MPIAAEDRPVQPRYAVFHSRRAARSESVFFTHVDLRGRQHTIDSESIYFVDSTLLEYNRLFYQLCSIVISDLFYKNQSYPSYPAPKYRPRRLRILLQSTSQISRYDRNTIVTARHGSIFHNPAVKW